MGGADTEEVEHVFRIDPCLITIASVKRSHSVHEHESVLVETKPKLKYTYKCAPSMFLTSYWPHVFL